MKGKKNRLTSSLKAVLIFILALSFASVAFAQEAPAPALEADPTALTFGAVDVGESVTAGVTLTNPGEEGDADITINALELTGSADFALVTDGTAAINLAPGASTVVEVSFTPSAEGPLAAELSVATGAEEPLIVPVEGEGVALTEGEPIEEPIEDPTEEPTPTEEPELEASDLGASTDLLNIAAGVGEEVVGSFELINLGVEGAADITISAVELTGDASLSLAELELPVVLAPGEDVTLDVTFAPAVPGAVSGEITVTHDGLTSPLIVPVAAEAARVGVQDRPLPTALAALRLDEPASMSDVSPASKINLSLFGAQGPQQVVVRLSEEPVVEIAASGRGASAQRTQLNDVRAQQQQLIDFARSLDSGAQLLGAAQKAVNVIMLDIDAADLPALAENPAVESINPVINYELALSETVPYIGATAVHDLGYTGEGIEVAVLDSGIDYLHANLGGSGDPADFANNDPTIIEPGTFPTDKVVGGYDFVGSDWDGSPTTPPLAPDPDPLDAGPGGGHGTHVADIIAGMGGVAPDADLYAVKVCSSVSTACSGVALIQGMDFAVDPDGNGDTSDHVDIINMSLGSDYGQPFDDDLTQAVNNATTLGVLTVAASGNGGDKPYITGTPAAAITALSVAQTNVPSAVQPVMEIVAPASIAGPYPAVHQSWSGELTSLIELPVQYADGAGGNLDGCAPFDPGTLTGKIVLVDRGSCNFSAKIVNIEAGGGEVGIIGLVAPGDPFDGGFGGEGPPTIPGYMINQATSNRIKSNLAAGVTIRFDPAQGIPLVGHMVGSSSRGPTNQTNIIKPEIGAPGASVSAVAGTGTGEEAFGGTSGATPMVSGSAALLMQAYPDRSPLEIKAVLVNSAETDIMNETALFGGYIAPITRIGGGEVRVDRALDADVAMWTALTEMPSLSFGFQDVTRDNLRLTRVVVLQNYTNRPILYRVNSEYRFDDDASNGAVTMRTPAFIIAPRNGKAIFTVTLEIDGSKLREWTLDSGANGANADLLTELEYDGYITLDNMWSSADNDNPLHLPWQVLPRLAGNVRATPPVVNINDDYEGIPAGYTQLTNSGVGAVLADGYSLIATSGNLPTGGLGEQEPIIDLRYVGYATYPVPAGYCSANDSFVMAFAINTWERQTMSIVPASFFIDIDTDQDGTYDYEIFNWDLSYPSISDGRNVAWVADLSAGTISAFFYTDHGTNSGNTVLSLCGEQIGMDASDFLTPMDIAVGAQDIYFTGNVTDYVDGITISPLGEQYLPVRVSDATAGSFVVGAGATDDVAILDFGPATNNTENGVLFLYDYAPYYNEAQAILVVP